MAGIIFFGTSLSTRGVARGVYQIDAGTGMACEVVKQKLSRFYNGGGPVTHTLLEGGKFFAEHKVDLMDLRTVVAEAIRMQKDLPSISERRSGIFPMYADLDLKVPVPTLEKEAVEEISRIMCSQLIKFYSSADLERDTFRCVVCKRSGASLLQEDGVRYKHGLHFHWPRILVNEEQALQMHASFVAGLSAQPTWQELLGAIAVDWEEAVDLSVYSGGLRMLGCPKALTCTSRCKGKKGMMLCMCNGTGHVYDRRVYEIHLAMVGDAPDPAYWSYLMDPEKPIRKMDDTTVRVFKDSETTETPESAVDALHAKAHIGESP